MPEKAQPKGHWMDLPERRFTIYITGHGPGQQSGWFKARSGLPMMRTRFDLCNDEATVYTELEVRRIKRMLMRDDPGMGVLICTPQPAT